MSGLCVSAADFTSSPTTKIGSRQLTLEKDELTKSIVYFQRAIQQDPNYALANAGLGNAYISMEQPWFKEDMRPRDVLPQAEAAARKASQIDASLADGHLALARATQLYDWDWPSVEKEYIGLGRYIDRNNGSRHCCSSGCMRTHNDRPHK